VQSIEPRLLLSVTSPGSSEKSGPVALNVAVHLPLSIKILSASPRLAASPAPYYGFSSPAGGTTPAQMAGAYLGANFNFDGISGDGTGQTIAIVDAYDDPGMVNSTSPGFATSDLAEFDAYYHLPNPPSFTKYGVNDQTATVTTTPVTATDPSGPYDQTGYFDWEVEESLDVEWAHAMAPNAAIDLIETSSDQTVFNGVQAATALPGVDVVSMSFSTDEANVGSVEPTYDPYFFSNPSITYLAATGDYGAYGTNGGEQNVIQPQYPATSADVVAVGGTSLYLSGNTWSGETTWGNGTSSGSDTGGGGGTSLYIPKPAYQTGLGSGTQRQIPDVALDANPSTGVPIFDSYDFGTGSGWVPGYVGGTSLATPVMAGLVAVADQGRAVAGLPTLNSNGISGGVDIHSVLYSLAGNTSSYAADFHDITAGNAIGPVGAPPNYSPETGYDLATGLGSPVAENLVFDLSGISTTPAANQPGITSLYFKQDTNSANTDVWVNAATPGVGTPSYVFPDVEIGSITYVGGSGNDSFTLDLSAGTALESMPLNINLTGSTGGTNTAIINTVTLIGPSSGSTAFTVAPNAIDFGTTAIAFANFSAINLDPAAGTNTLLIQGNPTAADAFVVTSSSVQFNSVAINFTDLSTVTLSPGTGTDSLAVNSGSVTIAPQIAGAGILTRNFSSISIATGGSAIFTTAAQHTDRTLVETASLSVTGQLDLGGNDLVIHNGSLPAVTALLATGLANGQWNGKGIASAAAHTNTTHLTALGIIQNTLYGGTGQPAFDGTDPLPTDILVKYTWYGDANLDGKVDGSDYSRIDSALQSGATGWYNGDFNYDGLVNGTDYALVDNAFNQQGAGL
jgi:hypothetical protein